MIPTDDSSSIDNKPEPDFNEIFFNYVTSENAIDCNNNAALNPINYESRTDKPRLAYEIYVRLIEMAIWNQWQATERLNQQSLISTIQSIPNESFDDKNSLLIAAYTGCNLIYRN